jgi:uncharacterized protein
MHINKQMTDFVINLLKTKIPNNYYYHNYEHTLYVVDKAIEIGKHEHCTQDELGLLAAAALWHDTGYINIYKGHEEESCLLAKKYLPGFGFDTGDIQTICDMIMATKNGNVPHSKPDAILVDADLEYLGTSNAEEAAELLFKEWQALTPSLSRADWKKIQVSFLQNHQYYTIYCKENKEPYKQAYLHKMLKNP